MNFTLLPAQFAHCGTPIRYTVAHPTPTDITLRIIDTKSQKTLGAKRYIGVTIAACDIAPYVRQAIHATPQTGSTGIYEATLAASIAVEASCSDPAAAPIVAPERCFIAGMQVATQPEIRTSMSRQRLISATECDELTLLVHAASRLTVTAEVGDSVVAESYELPHAGVWVFRLDVRDFAGASSLVVDGGACGSVSYTVVPALVAGQRMAWRSRSGSIEHYTFPVVRSADFCATKQHASGIGSGVTSLATERTLCSAYEVAATAEALAEIIASPAVWRCEGADYQKVEVLTDRVTTQRIGELCALEIGIRETAKTDSAWN